MGLYLLRGTISQLGQCEFNNDLVIYAYIEIIDETGARTLVKKVAIAVDVQAVIEPGTHGAFFIDDVFVPGRNILCQLWGVSTEDREVIDHVNLRNILATANMFRGIIFTPVLGIGLPHLVAGIGQTWSLLNGTANRHRFFRRAANGEIIAGKPGLSLGMPERFGLLLRSAGADLLRKQLRASGD